MVDGGALENQGIQPPTTSFVNKSEGSLGASSVKGSESKLGLIANLEKDTDVIEHADRAKVEALVGKIADFYNIPQRAREQGLKSEIYIMNNDGFERYVGKHFEQLMKREGKGEIETISKDDKMAEIFYSANGSSVEEENRRRAVMNQLIIQKAREHTEKLGGLTMPLDKGRSAILIREGLNVDKEMVEVHELIHAMSMGEDGEPGGFRSGERTSHRNIDEATAQVLALAFQHPEFTPKELLLSEIKTPYVPIARKLLVAMFATSQSKTPFTFKELAKYYFYQQPGMGIYLLQMDIIPRTREDVRGQIREWFSNDFKETSK